MDRKETLLIPNTTQIPNMLEDFVFPRIPEGEMRCLAYICRRTFGFRKKEDRISLTQFTDGISDREGNRLDYGAGVSRETAVVSLSNLAEAGAVIVRKDSRGNCYEINLEMDPEEVVSKIGSLRKERNEKKKRKAVRKADQSGKPTSQEGRPQVVRKVDRSGQGSRPKVVRKVDTQNQGKPREKPSSLVESGGEAFENASILLSKVRENFPFVKKAVPDGKDVLEMERLHRIDGNEWPEIRKVILWSQKDPFWKQNIRSVSKLRRQFETLRVKMESEEARPKKAFYRNMPMFRSAGRWKVRTPDGVKEFAGSERDIEWRVPGRGSP